ncbi:MAG TPA: OmpA family protein [Pirellulales bacterium]|jgi:chemotaxis protein MotB|nr:OmpA family protein [Pirellulales bacterium]
MWAPRFLVGSIACIAIAAAGCQFVPRSQLASYEAQAKSLNERCKAQQAELATLQQHARKVEDQLLKAEEELAMVDQRVGLDRKKLKNYEQERQVLREELEELAQNPAAPRHAGHNRKLAELAKRYPALKYDAATGMCKLETDVLFNSGESTLTPESRQALDEFAKLFAAGDAAQLRVMVVGHTDNRQIAHRETRERFPDNWHLSAARALNVADYLQKRGLREDQVGIAGFGRHEPLGKNATPDDRQRNRRVEIFVMAPDTPVIGWVETLPGVYR